MKRLEELNNDIAIRTGRIFKDENNNKYELVVLNSGYNCLLTIPKNKNSQRNLIYNRKFDIDSDELDNLSLEDYKDEQWGIVEQYS